MDLEREDLRGMLSEQRELLLITVRGISDEQAVQRTTASALTLAGIIKHMCSGEVTWSRIMTETYGSPDFILDPNDSTVLPHESLASLIESYRLAAENFDAAIAQVANLNAVITLPNAFWWPEPPRWSVRKMILHIIRETAHHSGHADIIREALDGANTTMQRAI